MLRRLAIVIFIAIVLPEYGQQQSPQSGSDQTNAEGAKNPTGKPSRVVTCTIKQDGTTIECKWPESEPEAYLKRLFSPENAPNIGIGGVAAAVVTLKKISSQTKAADDAAKAGRDSAEATLKSVKLQEAQLKQWLEIREWRADAEYPDRHWITLRCEVVNPTNMPLTLRTIHYQGLGGGYPAYDAQWGLPPKAMYPFQIPCIKLAANDLDDFDKGNLTFGAALTVGFDDAFGVARTQQFSVECVCGRYRRCEAKPRWGTTNPTGHHNQDPN